MNLQIARKEHKCDLCGNKILKGEKYWNNYDEDTGLASKEHTNCLLCESKEYRNDL